jgi:hypothetical protein
VGGGHGAEIRARRRWKRGWQASKLPALSGRGRKRGDVGRGEGWREEGKEGKRGREREGGRLGGGEKESGRESGSEGE